VEQAAFRKQLLKEAKAYLLPDLVLVIDAEFAISELHEGRLNDLLCVWPLAHPHVSENVVPCWSPTIDWSLSPQEMFRRYRKKDGVEKCFRLCKNNLQVSPLYLHSGQTHLDHALSQQDRPARLHHPPALVSRQV
jgi:transposase